jgi:hypothetical protein
MKKKLLLALSLALLASLVIATPTYAFSGIEFHVYDAVSLDPWGTTAGQSYRIYVWGSSSGALMDTGTLTTPGDPVLDFTCSYGGACAGTTLGTPSTGETVIVYIILTGTTGNPSTVIREYQQPPVDLGNYVISANSGTGPTAVTLSGTSAQAPSQWMLAALIALGVVVTPFVLRRRRIGQN